MGGFLFSGTTGLAVAMEKIAMRTNNRTGKGLKFIFFFFFDNGVGRFLLFRVFKKFLLKRLYI